MRNRCNFAGLNEMLAIHTHLLCCARRWFGKRDNDGISMVAGDSDATFQYLQGGC